MPPDPARIRAFIALKTPQVWDEELRDLQLSLERKLRSKAVRWVKPEQIHITLRFLGSILPAEAEEITALLQPIADSIAPFKLECEGLGCFPNLRRPRVIWAGISGAVQEVQRLQRQIAEATARFGEPAEDREFRPHLTLARVQDLEPGKTKLLQDVGFRIESPWNICDVLLMRSHLAPTRATYEVIGRAQLRGPA